MRRGNFRDVRRKVDSLSSEHPDFGETLKQSLDIVRQALDKFGGKKGGQGLAISFNGGKDACVVLYLLVLVLAERDQLELLSNKSIPVVYFEKEEFPEIEAFMKEVSNTYGFEYLRYASSYKEGMQDLVDSRGIEGIIMGQRRGDPWTESMEAFTPSTPGWAEFTRVNPALEWKFSDVWRFLRGSDLPYCVLYDQGYTSLGERGNTAKNEALRLPDGEYRPAYELAEAQEHMERSPRTPPEGKNHDSRADSAVSGLTEGGAGGTGGIDKASKVLKRSSTWDKTLDATDGSSRANVLQHGVLSDCIISGNDGNVKGPSAASIESESTATVPGGSLQVQTMLSRNCIDHPEPPTQALQATNERGAYVQPNADLQGKLTSRVGESLRWLPLTVAISLLLAAFGTRRSWLP